MRQLRVIGLAGVVASVIALALAPAAAHARVIVNEIDDVPEEAGGAVFNPCAGEVVVFDQGQIHILVTETADSSGGVHLAGEVNFAGVQGFGDTSGVRYVIPRSNASTSNITAANDTTATETFRLVRTGSDDDFLFHATFHLTTNANGDMTATVENLRISCSG